MESECSCLLIAILLVIFSGVKVNLVGPAVLIAWYSVAGRKQVALVKERYGSDYPRRSWGKPILFGVLGIVALYVCIFILLFIANHLYHSVGYNDVYS